ncbi:amidohydrolase family protein [Nonomuraea sp. NPDC050310]|uniref:amidohydrolase family protein n=1 Tax=unclassified Nonomuraea TaxID=2593643 RepID=UPI0033E83FAD
MKAVDVHTHPQTEEFLAAMGQRRAQMGSHFGKERRPVSFAAQADLYRERDMMAVIVNSAGLPELNDALGRAQSAHPDVFLAFCGVDPHDVPGAIAEVRRCHAEYGARGVGELNPGRQAFRPNDERLYPLWEVCAELGMPVMFHGGFLGAGAGTPGGMGYKLEHARPIPYLDDVAADFPELTVIAAHPAWPWHLDNLAACWHKANYYIDLSGWAPRYWPAEVTHYANSIITGRVLFGTDWPVLGPDRWIAEFEELGFKAESRQRIMLDNARELFGLG